ncbi:MAG TPA: site-specific integrase [Anaerolineae bacterium]|nr:site-specific integrase [Anaerolineae bacterium]
MFRSFKSHNQATPDNLTPQAIQNVLRAYPVMVNGTLHTVKPRDLRRTYARLLYDGGMDIVAIQQNLGHSNLQTTLRHIGDMGLEERRPPTILSFDL